MTKQIKKWLKMLFHTHKYRFIKELSCTFQGIDGEISKVPVVLYECMICKHRKVIRNSDFYYQKTFLKLLKMWKDREIEVENL